MNALSPRLVDEAEAARYCGRGRTRFREQVAKGQLPKHSDQNGRIKLWDIRVLDSFIDARSGLAQPKDTWAEL